MEIQSYSTPGGRPVNEDSVLGVCEGELFVAAVADGLGGHGGGALASQTALSTLERVLARSPCTKEAVLDAVAGTNAMVCSAGSGKTTVALVFGCGMTAVAAHVGDSRVYQFRDDQIVYQSRDHSVSQMAAAVGEITQKEIRGHPDRNKLLRALGSRNSAVPDCRVLELRPGDGLLLCSDGFWELIWEEEMCQAYQDSDTAGEWLGAMKRLLHGRLTAASDNASAVVLMI